MLRQALLIALCVVVRAAYEGDKCTHDGVVGICKNIASCPSAVEEIKNRKQPQICGFDKSDVIVCCIESVSTPAPTAAPTPPPTPAPTQPPVVTTTKRPTQVQTTTEYEPPLYDYETVDRADINDCPPIDPKLTSPKIGRKAWDMCLEYQEKLVYPCEKAVSLSFGADKERKVKCQKINADELIIGGMNASRNEFPHMALLGFGEEPNVQWLCGGTLISENFILTAGHCISSRDAGDLNYAYIGALTRNEVDPSKKYRIKKIHKHEDYKPPNRYNDIALLELDKKVPLDEWTKPACLHIGDQITDDRVVATGWGLTEYDGSSANILQKVALNKFTAFECMLHYPQHRLMKKGFDPETQTCYGDKSQSKDTCQGDSGGPLQIKHKKINCMYLIVGVTSFGKACGFIGEPGIYTKISYYVPWIESIVWP